MEQPIIGYHKDEEDDWVAELECGHNQHVRHDPPLAAAALGNNRGGQEFQARPSVGLQEM